MVRRGAGMVKAATRRRSLRRALRFACEVRSNYWDGAVPMPASDISDAGLWLDTCLPLEAGEEVVITLALPGTELPLWALADVARVGLWRRAGDAFPNGMGLSFSYVDGADRRRLRAALVGFPPRLPGRPRPPPLPHVRRSTCLQDEVELPAVLDVELAEALRRGARPAARQLSCWGLR